MQIHGLFIADPLTNRHPVFSIHIGKLTIISKEIWPLTHYCRDTMADIFQTTFQIDFLQWKQLFYFDSNFTEITNSPALVQLMAWCRSHKSLYKTMMVRLPTHLFVSRSQLINTFRSRGAYVCQIILSLVFKSMAYRFKNWWRFIKKIH